MHTLNRSPLNAGMFIVILGASSLSLGCSKEKPATQADTKPFEAAIVEYCQSKGYGMKIASVESVNVNGDTATALCKMAEAEGTYGLKVKWEFTFHRTDGGWQVETHTTK